jgi:hypothetical protein
MREKKWIHAAWMAIAAAALTPANLFLSLLADLPIGEGTAVAFGGRPGVGLDVLLALLAVTVGTVASVLSLVALYRFRELLNERYGFHGIDKLVTFVIMAIAVLMFVSVVGRMAMALLGFHRDAVYVALLFVIPIMLLTMAVGIAGIIVGIKLLSLDNDLQHLIRPYGLISIIGGVCFAVVVLAPVGMLLLIAENVVLALTFFRAGESEPTVEFV